MKRIVLDTNCLIVSLPKQGKYHCVWKDFIEEKYILCISNEIMQEYEEILAQKTTPQIAENVIFTILNKENIVKVYPRFRFELIKSDPDDNKFVDCAIISNAAYIVSEDSHFKELRDIDFPKVEVIQLHDFIKLYHG